MNIQRYQVRQISEMRELVHSGKLFSQHRKLRLAKAALARLIEKKRHPSILKGIYDTHLEVVL